MDAIIYQKIATLRKRLNIVHKSYCDASEAPKREDLWEEVRAIETEIDELEEKLDVEVIIYQKIEELKGKLDIVHRSYCVASEVSKRTEL